MTHQAQPRGRRFAPAAVALLAISAASCAGPPVEIACPAIAYASTLFIDFEGDASDVEIVYACADGECPSGLVLGEDPEFASDGRVVAATSLSSRQGVWAANLFFPGSGAIGIRAVDANGTTLVDTTVSPDWVRTGGSEQCGGPHEATVTVHVPG